MKIIEKGSIVLVNGWWFVVVMQNGDQLFCICDNANNIYSHDIDEPNKVLSSNEAMRLHGWGNLPDEDESVYDIIKERPIPVDVIAEVLSGCHDDRFNHWVKK